MLFDQIQIGDGFTFPWSPVVYIKDSPKKYHPEVPVDDDDDYKRVIASVNQTVEPVK